MAPLSLERNQFKEMCLDWALPECALVKVGKRLLILRTKAH